MKTLIVALLASGAAGFVAAQPAPTASSPAPSERMSYQAKVKADLADIGAKIDALEASAKKEETQAAAKIHADVKKLRAGQKKADARLKKVESAGEDAWKSLQADLDRAVADLRKAYDKATAPKPGASGKS